MVSFVVAEILSSQMYQLLNQAHAGRPVHTWFPKIDPVRIVGMRACVCVSAPEAIKN